MNSHNKTNQTEFRNLKQLSREQETDLCCLLQRIIVIAWQRRPNTRITVQLFHSLSISILPNLIALCSLNIWGLHEAKLPPKWDVWETGFIMRKFLPKIGFLFEKLGFRQLKNRNKRVLGGALLSTEHVIRMLKGLHSFLCFYFPAGSYSYCLLMCWNFDVLQT